MKFNYSMKNIPIPSDEEYIKKLIYMSEHLCRRMRWKAYFYLHPEAHQHNKQTYGFRSRKTPPPILQLQSFEQKLQKLITNVSFRRNASSFQKTLAADAKRIKSSTKLLIPADKTANYYSMEARAYKELLHNAITKDYKKTNTAVKSNIHCEAKSIAKDLDIDDRVAMTTENDAFITLKDHKPNFSTNPSCRLINPTKSEIGKISKQILEKINGEVLNTTKLNLWRNTNAVINWFKNINCKQECSFILFDVVEFYPSITPELLGRALDHAAAYTNITPNDRHIIYHTKQSILVSEAETWVKKSGTFDIAMGSYDGAECCELVGLFLLSEISKELQGNFGLYRDDGLSVIKATAQKIENIKKKLCNLFKRHGLRITVEANSKIVNYLDVTLNLPNGSYSPFMKSNNSLRYVNKQSNHPPQITKNIPKGINNRLSTISSDSRIFYSSITPYQDALKDSGYNEKLEYASNNRAPNATRRKRNVTWYNPPYSQNITANIGQKFLRLVSQEFPNGHPLHAIFNRNTLKVSYSCMKNMRAIIKDHNRKLLNTPARGTETGRTCNCRQPANCPMEGKCLEKSIIYQATVTAANNRKETYIGLTEGQFKTRYNNHTASFRHSSKRSATELSNFVWSLKDQNIDYTINWKIVKHGHACNSGNSRCGLCITEKFYIIFQPHMATLNDRRSLITSCRHANKFILANQKS